MSDTLSKGLERLQIEPTDGLLKDISHYLLLLEKWNRTYNLTSINDPQERIVKHILDSLSIAPYLVEGALLDVGTGAGLPGLIIGLLQRERPITLIDSNQKKVRFLAQACLELKLHHVKPIHSRIEQFQVESAFENIVCRAFTSLKKFIDSTDPLLVPQGQWLAMKGVVPREEMAEIDAMEIDQDVVSLSVPFLDAERHLIRLRRLDH